MSIKPALFIVKNHSMENCIAINEEAKVILVKYIDISM